MAVHRPGGPAELVAVERPAAARVEGGNAGPPRESEDRSGGSAL